MKKATIIAGFPGVGKTEFMKRAIMKGYTVSDSDSSQYSWKKDAQGRNTKERHPDFPHNYMSHIEELYNSGEVDYILVSTHSEVISALWKKAFPYTILYPSLQMKEEMLERYRQRKSPQGFIDLMEANYENFVQQILDRPKSFGVTFTELESGQYLSTLILGGE
ncbi:MAG: hypothetical protein ACRCX2_22120 [Paraclostridium sp.]